MKGSVASADQNQRRGLYYNSVTRSSTNNIMSSAQKQNLRPGSAQVIKESPQRSAGGDSNNQFSSQERILRMAEQERFLLDEMIAENHQRHMEREKKKGVQKNMQNLANAAAHNAG